MSTMFGEAFGETQTYTAARPSTTCVEGLLASDSFIAPAIALYTQLGKREDVLHFDIAVPGRGGR
jgi:hypothetical protein